MWDSAINLGKKIRQEWKRKEDEEKKKEFFTFKNFFWSVPTHFKKSTFMLFQGWKFCHVSSTSLCTSRSVVTGFLTVCVSFAHLLVQVLPVDTLGRAWLVNACMTPLPGSPVDFSFTSAVCDIDWQSGVQAAHLRSLSHFCLQSSSTPVLQLQKWMLQIVVSGLISA